MIHVPLTRNCDSHWAFWTFGDPKIFSVFFGCLLKVIVVVRFADDFHSSIGGFQADPHEMNSKKKISIITFINSTKQVVDHIATPSTSSYTQKPKTECWKTNKQNKIQTITWMLAFTKGSGILTFISRVLTRPIFTEQALLFMNSVLQLNQMLSKNLWLCYYYTYGTRYR